MNVSRMRKLEQDCLQTVKAICSRHAAIRLAYPPDYSRGMLAISHVEYFARIAQLFTEDAILKDLRRQHDLIAARMERLSTPRPPRTQRAGAFIQPEAKLADAVAVPRLGCAVALRSCPAPHVAEAVALAAVRQRPPIQDRDLKTSPHVGEGRLGIQT